MGQGKKRIELPPPQQDPLLRLHQYRTASLSYATLPAEVPVP